MFRFRLPSFVRRAVLGLSLVLAGATFAPAADFCISGTFGPVFVGKAFRVPPRGKCATFLGVFASTNPNAASGSACTASDGSHVTVQINTSLTSGTIYHDIVELALPALVGTDSYYSYPSSTLNGPDTVFGGSCPTQIVSKVDPRHE